MTVGYPKFPHVDRLRSSSPIHLFKSVVCTEKLDGTNFRTGIEDGQFWVGGRNIVFGPGDDSFGAVAWARSNDLEAKIRAWNPYPSDAPITLFGELYGPGIQKRIDYGQERRVAFFDVMIGDTFLDPDDASQVIRNLGLLEVPIVYAGPIDMQRLDELVAEVTLAGIQKDGNIREGVVIRPPIRLKDKRGEWIIAKHKNPAFDEIVPESKTPKFAPGLEADVAHVLSYVTGERLNHILTYLREEGREINQTLTGDVIKRMLEDILREGELTEEQKRVAGKVAPAAIRNLFFASLEGAA